MPKKILPVRLPLHHSRNGFIDRQTAMVLDPSEMDFKWFVRILILPVYVKAERYDFLALRNKTAMFFAISLIFIAERFCKPIGNRLEWHEPTD